MMTTTDATTARQQALEQLAYARLQNAATREAYRTALLTAKATGATYAEIGKALGITRQAARTAVLTA